MPQLKPLGDGRFSLTLSLPTGTYIQYKYTLGDGFWNAEHSKDGNFIIRQFLVPDKDMIIEDNIESWYSGAKTNVTFDVTVPSNTPPDDFVSIQFNPVFGWTEAIPMWNLGNNRWGYVLYSPLNLPGNFSYRYCRNNQCGTADDAATPGQYGAGRPINLEQPPPLIKDQVNAWIDLGPPQTQP
jgi:hypothetical protein